MIDQTSSYDHSITRNQDEIRPVLDRIQITIRYFLGNMDASDAQPYDHCKQRVSSYKWKPVETRYSQVSVNSHWSRGFLYCRSMSIKSSAKEVAKPSKGIGLSGEERRHSLVLRAWEVINSERELQGVIEAVAEVLVPVVPFFGIAIIAPEARQDAPWAMHVIGDARLKSESVDEFSLRMREKYPPRKAIP